MAANDLSCTLYEDTVIHGTRDHPDIAVINVGEGKTLALQVHGTRQIMGRTCNTTQVSTLFLCPAFTLGEDVEWDTDIIKSIASQSHLFIQISTGRYITKIMQYLCESRKKIQRICLLQIHREERKPLQAGQFILY